MDKTITIILAVMVLMISGLSVAILGTDAIGDFDSDANEVSTSQSCQYEAQKIEEGELDPSEASDECSFDTSVQNDVLAQQLSDVLQ